MRRGPIAISILVTLTAVSAVLLISQSMISKMDTSAQLKQPRILITKKARTLQLFDGNNLVKSLRISLGFSPVGNKEIEGDGKTPEGEFYVFTKNPESRFHLSLGLSYPSKPDAERGLKANLISKEE